jgi:hypothetical protein
MHVETDDDGNLVADHAKMPTAAITEDLIEARTLNEVGDGRLTA